MIGVPVYNGPDGLRAITGGLIQLSTYLTFMKKYMGPTEKEKSQSVFTLMNDSGPRLLRLVERFRNSRHRMGFDPVEVSHLFTMLSVYGPVLEVRLVPPISASKDC